MESRAINTKNWLFPTVWKESWRHFHFVHHLLLEFYHCTLLKNCIIPLNLSDHTVWKTKILRWLMKFTQILFKQFQKKKWRKIGIKSRKSHSVQYLLPKDLIVLFFTGKRSSIEFDSRSRAKWANQIAKCPLNPTFSKVWVVHYQLNYSWTPTFCRERRKRQSLQFTKVCRTAVPSDWQCTYSGFMRSCPL